MRDDNGNKHNDPMREPKSGKANADITTPEKIDQTNGSLQVQQTGDHRNKPLVSVCELPFIDISAHELDDGIHAHDQDQPGN